MVKKVAIYFVLKKKYRPFTLLKTNRPGRFHFPGFSWCCRVAIGRVISGGSLLRNWRFGRGAFLILLLLLIFQFCPINSEGSGVRRPLLSSSSCSDQRRGGGGALRSRFFNWPVVPEGVCWYVLARRVCSRYWNALSKRRFRSTSTVVCLLRWSVFLGSFQCSSVILFFIITRV